MEELLQIPLSQICPRPGFNPRKTFDEAALVGLAESIHSQGVQQPIVVRSAEPSPHGISISPADERKTSDQAAQIWGILNDRTGLGVEQVVGHDAAKERARQLSECHYHIVMGERRWRASFIAGKATIPAIVRNGLDDDTYYVRALLENIQRQDLDPIEEAEGYRELARLGYTQEQIGDMVGRGQTGIAKALRLLKLPEDVQALLHAGKLSVSHALAILRFEQFPAVMSEIAACSIEAGASSRSLEKGVPFQETLRGKKLLIALPSYNAPFNIEAVCTKCPFDAYRKTDYGNGVCLNPAHYKELEDGAQAALQETLRAASEASQRRAQESLREAEAAQAAAATRADKERAQKDVDAAKKVIATVKKSLPKISELQWGTYAKIDSSCPSECTADCPCRSKAEDYNGKIIDICVEPSRMNRFKAAHTRDEQKERRARFDDLRARIVPQQTQEPDTRGLALIALRYLTSHESGKTDALKAARLPQNAPPDLAAIMDGKLVDSKRAWNALASLSAAACINLVTEVLLRQEMHQAHEYKSDAIPATAWWLNSPAASSERVRVRTFQNGKEVIRAGTRVSFQGGYVSVQFDGETTPSSHEADRVQVLQDVEPETPTTLAQTLPDCFHCGNTISQGEGNKMVEAEINYFVSSGDPNEQLFCPTCVRMLENIDPDKVGDEWSYLAADGRAKTAQALESEGMLS